MDLRVKYVSLEEGFDFVIEDATEDLGDIEALISYLKIPLTGQTFVKFPCSRHWTASERVSKLGRGCCPQGHQYVFESWCTRKV